MNKFSCGRFVGKKVVITGAAQGIGKHAAERMGTEGASVVLVDRSDEVTNVVAEFKEKGIDAYAVLADMEDYDGVSQAFTESLAVLGEIDVLVNNVGGTIWLKPFVEYKKDEIEKEVKRSFWPTMWCCHVFAQYFVEQKAGAIVNVSSIASRATNRVPYSACKGGVNFLTTSLAMELGAYGIRVNAVAPGATDVGPRKIPRNTAKQTQKEADLWASATQDMMSMTPLNRMGQCEDQAAAIAFLASDDAAYVTGEILSVGGGFQG